ncbi:uncharacterized protein ACN2A1_013052 isoform 1-T3 [Glossina fuscipes fuscipes]
MECLYTPCRAKTSPESDRFVSCWLCERFGYAKCAGIVGRAADAVGDPSKGLRWSCPDCRQRDIDFYKLFTETRNGFSELSRNLGSLWEKFELIKSRFDECRFIEHSSTTRSVACGTSPLGFSKSGSLVQVTAPSNSKMNSNFSDIAESVGSKTVINKRASLSVLSYAEVARVSPPRAATHSNQAPSLKSNEVKNKSSSSPGCSRVNAGHQTGQVSQAAGTMAITPSIFSPTLNSPIVNPPPIPSNDLCLTAVPPRKAIFVSRLAPETSVDNVKSYLAAKVPSVNLKRVSIFKMAPSQSRAISSFKILVPTENSDMLLNKSLWPVGSLIKEFIPRDRPRNTKADSLVAFKKLHVSSGPLSLIYQNVRGLNSKIRSSFLNSVSTEFFCLAFTETWLKPDLHSSELFHNSFEVFRNDRLNRIGGGVPYLCQSRPI